MSLVSKPTTTAFNTHPAYLSGMQQELQQHTSTANRPFHNPLCFAPLRDAAIADLEDSTIILDLDESTAIRHRYRWQHTYHTASFAGNGVQQEQQQPPQSVSSTPSSSSSTVVSSVVGGVVGAGSSVASSVVAAALVNLQRV